MKKKEYTWITALGGVIVGILLSSIIFRYLTKDLRFDGDYNSWRKLNLILSEIENNYVDTVDKKLMTDAAVVAALTKLDPHSVYLPPIDLKTAETELAGNFDGIGIQFNVPDDTAIVLSVIPGGPSEKAGLLMGDRIIKVNDDVIAGTKTPQDSMVARMKGPSGTKVKVTVNREGVNIPFEITRGKIPVHCVDASFMLDDTTAYLRLSKFTRSTYSEVDAAADKLLSQGMKKLVFDVRGNSGGYFDQAFLVCNEFLEKNDLIVYMEGLHRKRRDYKADGSGKLKDVELVVLIDESSASSSEIFAGAIQDNDRGLIVGRRSYGKGLVQEPVNFTDGSGLRLTVARFYTPSGRCIQKPYSDKYDYAYDIYERYAHGEMTEADSMKVDRTTEYYTTGGRVVYGGGGILPDVFVPIDTTRAGEFFVKCNKNALQMRFASSVFDRYKARLSQIDNFDILEQYLDSLDLRSKFIDYAASHGAVLSKSDTRIFDTYMMPQIKALTGRYSKLEDEAFYHFYLEIDETLSAAMNALERQSD